jgi:hypothetical protein
MTTTSASALSQSREPERRRRTHPGGARTCPFAGPVGCGRRLLRLPSSQSRPPARGRNRPISSARCRGPHDRSDAILLLPQPPPGVETASPRLSGSRAGRCRFHRGKESRGHSPSHDACGVSLRLRASSPGPLLVRWRSLATGFAASSPLPTLRRASLLMLAWLSSSRVSMPSRSSSGSADRAASRGMRDVRAVRLSASLRRTV